MRKLLPILLLLVAPLSYAQLYSGVLNSNRGVNWSLAGIPGGLPDAGWTQCGSTIAAGASVATINSQLAGCSANTYVLLGAGTFNLAGAINLPNSGKVVLRGSGASSTILNFSSNAGSNCGGAFVCMSGTASNSIYRGALNSGETVHNVTAGLSQGSTSLTLDSVTGITANQTMMIMTQCDTGTSGATCTGSETDNNGYWVCAAGWTSGSPSTSNQVGCSVPGENQNGQAWRPGGTPGNAWQVEEFMVTNVAGSVVTINRPLHYPNWSTGQSPQVIVFNSTQLAGFENFKINTNGSTSFPMQVSKCYECWVSGVSFVNFGRQGLAFLGVINGIVQNNYFYATPVPPGDGEALDIHEGSFNLVQNNIFHHTNGGILQDGPEDSDVIAYNFGVGFTNNGCTSSCSLLSLYESHSTGDDWTLVEGNIGSRLDDDLDHGNHLSQTYFRNFTIGYDNWINGGHGGATQPSLLLDPIMSGNADRYANYVANVWGTPGYATNYMAAVPSNQFGNKNIYILGAASTAAGPPGDFLAQCGTATGSSSSFTDLCWGNYDTVHAAVQCNTSEVPTSAPTYPNSVPTLGCGGGTLPPSFYLSSKPAWWPVSIPWPAIGPDVSNGKVGQCSGTLFTVSQAGLPATAAAQCSTGIINLAWGSHVNPNPAMACYIAAGGLPDGTGAAITFNPATCYISSGPVASLTPNPLAFGTVNIGSNTTLTATLLNAGNATLTLSNPYYSFTGTNAADMSVSSATCTNGGSLAANASCTVTIKFTPSVNGAESGSFNILGNALASISLTGTGAAVTGAVTLNPGTSTGKYVQGCAYAPTGAGPFTTVACTMPAAQTLNDVNVCTIAWGTTGTLTSVTDTASNSYGATVLNTSVSFGQQSAFVSAPIAAATPTITGNFSVGVQGPEIKCSEYQGPVGTADVSANGATGTTGTTLTSGTVATTFANDLLVAFGLGNITAAGTGYTLRYTVDGTDAAEDQLVSATGNYNATFTQASGPWLIQLLTLKAPQSLIFGSQNNGVTSSAKTITATNSGGVSSTLSTPFYTITTGNSADFAVASGTCSNGLVLAVGSSCTIGTTFTPGAAGNRASLLTFNTNNSAGTVALSGVGVGAAQCGTPTFSPVAGTYSTTQTVTFASGCSSGTYCSTLDGTTPTANGSGTCTHGATGGSVSVSVTETVNAISSKSGNSDSAVGSAAYTITPAQLATPTFSPSVPYNGTSTTSTITFPVGSTGCYTTDGSTPTTNGAGACINGTFYASGIPVNVTTTIKAIATQSGYMDSAVATGAYTISNTVGLPVFAIIDNKAGVSQTISITSPTASATICYTTNGVPPQATVAGTCNYGTTLTNGGSVVLYNSTILQAIGTLSSYTNSSVAIGIILLGGTNVGPTPSFIILM